MPSDNEQLSTWVPPELAAQIRAAAAKERRTVSMWLRLLAEEELAVAAEEAAA